jgi:hypothetical protein
MGYIDLSLLIGATPRGAAKVGRMTVLYRELETELLARPPYRTRIDLVEELGVRLFRDILHSDIRPGPKKSFKL